MKLICLFCQYDFEIFLTSSSKAKQSKATKGKANLTKLELTRGCTELSTCILIRCVCMCVHYFSTLHSGRRSCVWRVMLFSVEFAFEHRGNRMHPFKNIHSKENKHFLRNFLVFNENGVSNENSKKKKESRSNRN